MKKLQRISEKTLYEQFADMKSKHPKFIVDFDTHTSMIVKGTLQPTPRSTNYHFVMRYGLSSNPNIRIISPSLIKNSKDDDIPHLYGDGSLCLYQPKYREFKRTSYLSDTIIPWTSLWLYHYEVWLMTNEWCGGGEHPR